MVGEDSSFNDDYFLNNYICYNFICSMQKTEKTHRIKPIPYSSGMS